MSLLFRLSLLTLAAGYASARAILSEQLKFDQALPRMQLARGAMLASIRTSWEQGTAAMGLLEFDSPQNSIFGSDPFGKGHGPLPATTLQLALSAVVRQSADGRLSQVINDAKDGAALDGASAGPAVLLGLQMEPSRKDFWTKGAEGQLNYLLNTVPRTSTGALSHRSDSKQYWADGMYMGFPFLAYYGAVTKNQTLLQMAYDQLRLYRNALLEDGPTGPLLGHIFSDDSQTWSDKGLWATGNGWAVKGMLQVAVTIQRSAFGHEMAPQVEDLKAWIKQILDGTLSALTPENLVPDYISGNSATFGDSASSACIAAAAYRSATLWPKMFGSNYTVAAGKVRDAILGGIDHDLGLLSPLVDPLSWSAVGILSTEGQAFGLMLFSAWRDWITADFVISVAA